MFIRKLTLGLSLLATMLALPTMALEAVQEIEWQAVESATVTYSRPVYVRGSGYYTDNTISLAPDSVVADQYRLVVTSSSHPAIDYDGLTEAGYPYFNVSSISEAVRIDFGLKRARFAYTTELQQASYLTTLVGLVTDDPIPHATVTVTIGGRTFTTVADENGAYTLDIASVALDSLILIEANATNEETGVPINLVNLMGSFDKAIEDPETNVTNVTTAKFSLVLEANGDAAPTTLEELQTAETSVDATELIELAAVIKLVLDDPRFELPEGYDSVVEFIADEEGVATFTEQVVAEDPQAIENTIDVILADSDLVEGFTADTIPERYLAVPAANPGFLARSGSIIEFNADNTGSRRTFLEHSGEHYNTPFTWVVESGALEMSFSEPERSISYTQDIHEVTTNQAEIDRFIAAGGLAQDGIEVEISTLSEKMTLVSDGELVDIVVAETRTEKRVTHQLALADGTFMTIAEPLVSIDVSNDTLRDGNALTIVPFTQTCEASEVCAMGRWSGMFHYSPGINLWSGEDYLNTAFGEVMTFMADGSVTGIISDKTAAWHINVNGEMVITYDDGLVQTITLLDQKGIEFGALSTYRLGDEYFELYSLWIRGDDNFEFAPETLVLTDNNAWNSDLNNWIPELAGPDGGRNPTQVFGWQFNLDGTGTNMAAQTWDYDEDGVDDLNLALTPMNPGYVIDGDRLLINRFSFAKRFWFPVALYDDSGTQVLYHMEMEYRDAEHYGAEPGTGYRVFIAPRINIQRETLPYDGWDFIIDMNPR